jgi:hypothetical protein
MFADVSLWLYQLENFANGLVDRQLAHISPLSVGVIFLVDAANYDRLHWWF